MCYLFISLINLPHFQQDEAVWWFIPIIVYSAIWGGVSGIIFGLICEWLNPVKGHSIAVLGMIGAGKTQFLSNLRNIDYNKFSTLGEEKYEKFKTTIGNREVIIEAGIDIPGGPEYIKDYYKVLVDKNEIIFFIFNSYNYLNNRDYRNETQARLDFIYDLIKGKEKSTMLFGTFADQFKDDSERKDAYKKIKESVINKSYYPLFKSNYAILDMRNKKELYEKILLNIFK